MKLQRSRLTFACIAVLLLAGVANAEEPATTQATTQPAPPQLDTATFDLRAISPPIPAMKYQLQIDPLDRWPGNAATAYLEVNNWITNSLKTQLDSAEDADEHHDQKTFDSLAPGLITSGMLDELETAARRDTCDFGSPVRQLGYRTLLPHLNLMRTLANLLAVRATYQIRHGDTDAAIRTLQLAYRMPGHLGQEPSAISGLVAIGLAARAHHVLIELMNRTDAPNLYWALAGLPHPLLNLSTAVEGERTILVVSFPVLEKGRSGNINPADWKLFLDEKSALADAFHQPPNPVTEESAAAAAKAFLPTASAYYAQTRGIPLAKTSTIDPALLAATYVIEQNQIASDDMYKLANLPYAQSLPLANELSQRVKHPNPLLPELLDPSASFGGLVRKYARTERELAALTAVEAIRSFAAVHAGALPANLADILETPVPVNPVTGQAFEYRVEGDTATLSDHSTIMSVHLEFKIHIRPQ